MSLVSPLFYQHHQKRELCETVYGYKSGSGLHPWLFYSTPFLTFVITYETKDLHLASCLILTADSEKTS